MKKKVIVRIIFAIVLAVTWGAVQMASASVISPGYDYFESLPGTSVDMSGFGLGVVLLEGVPFLTDSSGDDIDTVVERKQGLGPPFDPVGDSGIIEIELVALHLVSIAPVDLTPLGGLFIGVFADLHTTINKDGFSPDIPQPDVLNPSIGKMEIRHDTGPLPTDDIGGHFDSAFAQPGDGTGVPSLEVLGGGVWANGIFTLPGGDPSNPMDILFSTAAPRIVLWSMESLWEHGISDFQVTAIDHFGPHIVDPRLSPVPEPATLLMFGLGALIVRRKR